MFRAIGGVCLAFGETHFNILCGVVDCLSYAWCHFDLRACRGEVIFHPSLLIDEVGSCICFYGITHNC